MDENTSNKIFCDMGIWQLPPFGGSAIFWRLFNILGDGAIFFEGGEIIFRDAAKFLGMVQMETTSKIITPPPNNIAPPKIIRNI